MGSGKEASSVGAMFKAIKEQMAEIIQQQAEIKSKIADLTLQSIATNARFAALESGGLLPVSAQGLLPIPPRAIPSITNTSSAPPADLFIAGYAPPDPASSLAQEEEQKATPVAICKKKVKKVLHSIEEVYKTDIDIQHQKVVVIGNVSVDTLVKKLVKTGKHAEPWPEPAPPPAAANSPGGATGGGGGGGKKKKKNKNKNPANNKPSEAAPQAAATEEGGGGGPIPPEKHDHASPCDEASDDEPDKPEGTGSPKKLGAGDAHDGGAGAVVPFAMTPHGKQPIAPNANANGNGGGGGGKKKGKKGGNGNANANGDGTGAIAAVVEVNPPDAPMKPAPGNAVPLAVVDAGVYPPATAMSYPGYYAAGGHLPPYVMSYSTAHPLRSSAYYHPMVGAAYTGGVGGGYFYSTAPVSAAPGSYYMFSEENANACSVM